MGNPGSRLKKRQCRGKLLSDHRLIKEDIWVLCSNGIMDFVSEHRRCALFLMALYLTGFASHWSPAPQNNRRPSAATEL